jgi:hypothetical protein
MAESRIDCKNITKINCDYFGENRLCPDDCKGFISNKEIVEDSPIEIIKNKKEK